MPHDNKNQGAVDKVFGFIRSEAQKQKAAFKSFDVIREAGRKMRSVSDAAQNKAKGK